HGQAAERAVPGRRTALALVGVDKSELARGDVAVTGAGWRATTLLDAAVELLPGARKPIGSRTRLRVHLGTAEVLARVVQIRSIGPGEHGLARLVLETPLVARGGDRFVVRSFSPVTTIGGGVVLDPFPAPRPRLRPRRLAAGEVPTLAELEREFPGAPIRALLAHLAREGTAEPIDQERYAAPQALESFRSGLEAALAELGKATPAELRERFGLTRKYLIPLLE